MKTDLSGKENLKTSYRALELSGIEAISGLALLLEKKDFLHTKHLIISSEKNLEKLKSFLHFKKPSIPWYDLPSFPKPKSPYSESIRFKRRSWQSWAGLAENSPALFLASPQALLKKTNTSLNCYIIKTGENFNASYLENYEEKAFVEKAGDFSSRAFLMDIFSPAYKTPLRVQLMGKKIQSIHLLDAEFKRRQRELKQALIPSPYEWSFKGEDRKKLCAYLKKQENLLNRSLPPELFKSFSRGELYFGFENLLNCLDENCSLNYFPDPPQIWLVEPEESKAHFVEEKSKLEREHSFFTEGNLFLSWDEIEKQRENQETNAALSGKTFSFPLVKLRASFLKSLSSEKQNLTSSVLKNFSSSLFKKSKNLKEDLKKLPVYNIVFAGTEIEELKKILLKEKILTSPKEDFFEGKNLIFLPTPIKESFFCRGDTAYLKTEDFIMKKKQSLSHFDFFRQRARALEFSKLEMGDLLVHRQHGIGEFAGLQSLTMRGKREDFIVLNYKEGDKLFVPAYRVSQVKRYSRKRTDQITKTLLDRLGNPKAWERKKSQAKKHIQSLAIELIEIYRLRKQKKAEAFCSC